MASRLRYLRAPLAADVLGGAQLPSRLAKTETHAFAGEMTATDVAPHPQVDRSAECRRAPRAPARDHLRPVSVSATTAVDLTAGPCLDARLHATTRETSSTPGWCCVR